MSRGISQEQVNEAARNILTAGERPTVERVRLALGTGSPNTVTRMLDAWRAALGQELVQRRALPSLPAAVGQAAEAMWSSAIDAARDVCEGQLADERASLQAKATSMAVERHAMSEAVQLAKDEAELSGQQRRHADAQVEAKQALIDHLEGRLTDLAEQLVLQTGEASTLHTLVNALQNELGLRAAEADARREAYDERVRVLEDRAYGEVDRVRQEHKRLGATLARAEHELERLRVSEASTVVSLRKALLVAEQRGTAHLARATALEEVLNTLPRAAPAPAAKTPRRARKVVTSTPRKGS